VRLEDVTAELRPRSDWEAVDLGLALARRDFWRLFVCWWLGMLPVVVLSFVFLHDTPILLLLVCLWFVPIGSRMVLFVVSRHLFGELPSWKATFREWPRAIFRRFFFRMIWARLSPWRPLTMAVEDLEGLRGKDYAQRVRLLLRRGDATVVALALWRVALTIWLAAAIFGTGVLFLPHQTGEEWWIALDSWDGSWLDLPGTLMWSITLSCLLSMSLVDVFSTGAGFGIYVNHRTWIEGWDVELAFRRLANRLRGASSALLAVILIMFSVPAADAATTPKETIDSVKSHEDFTIHKVEERAPDAPKPSGGGGADLSWLGVLGQIVLYLVLAAAIAFVVSLIWRYRHLLRGRSVDSGGRLRPPPARVVMGMDVAPETLPPDIPAAALELWRVGRRQEAMSLLYRGAISRLIEAGKVEISESDTESDCMRRVAAEAAPHAPYFGGLTEAWMRLAYGRTVPADETIRELCARWPFSERRSA